MNLLGVDGEHLGHVNHYFHTHWIQAGKFKIRIQLLRKHFKKLVGILEYFLG
jgi:hypothetical protein